MADLSLLAPHITHTAVHTDCGIHPYVEQLLHDEIDRLGLSPAARDQLLPPYVRAGIIEVVTRTMLRLAGHTLNAAPRESRR